MSPLLFPARPYHALVKDDKLQTEELNNPLNDSIQAKNLFFDEVAAFRQLHVKLQQIFYFLLRDKSEFKAFFHFLSYIPQYADTEFLIREQFKNEICEQSDLTKIIADHPIELSYCLSLINANNRYSITPPWVLKNYPEVDRIMAKLRNRPCMTGCVYCNKALDIQQGLNRFFNFNSFRTYGGEPLQEKAVQAAVDNKSLLAVFPTGGGKSITFQLPALMSGENVKGLTVIISPLQSLMKDQVDNLEASGITDAVTINGLLDPVERGISFERVENGSASLLYISPESLRSKTIERLLLGRKIIRFVIDEAHCFSSWGQDFRVDYLYIGDFIKSLQQQKNNGEDIPVSCFTATAKQKVIEDIRDYFRQKLSIELEVFSSKASRTNLKYKVIEQKDEEEKYQTVRDLIIEKNCATIIYVSRTRKAYQLAERLVGDGFNSRPYHGKMEAKEKTENQNAFISGETQIMVATSAFGMGVDKKDVKLVIHFEISDSLENYIQEAGRAGRDEKLEAECFALFNEEDLSKHFILLNQTRLSIKEIQQIWKAIKDLTRFKNSLSNSALEIARKAGWDDNIKEIETRVKTAVAALEDAGYLKRQQNAPRVYADSIRAKNAQEAIGKINSSTRFEEKQKTTAIRIIKKLISSRSKKQANNETPESRIDYIGDHLGIRNDEVINIITILQQENILNDAKDLTAFIKRGEGINRSLYIVEMFNRIEVYLLNILEEQEKTFHIKELNEDAEKNGCEDVTPNKIKTILNFWAIKHWIRKYNQEYTKNHVSVISLHPPSELQKRMETRHKLAGFIVKLLYERTNQGETEHPSLEKEILVEFSVLELKEAYENSPDLFKVEITVKDIEDSLFYLSRIEAIKIEGGFLVIYNRLNIERLELDNKKRYKVEDYQKLNQFYENKIQQIHIVGEYAKKMVENYKEALQFVEDYFQLNYSFFLNKYFNGERQKDINFTLTPEKFKQLFGGLSLEQINIIKDKNTQYKVVLAGPGSGKTKVLVHKLASLILMEDVKHEQLLMVTFSRAATTEFKKRLRQLIGNAAQYIEIKTFHSYCFDLLGKVGSLEKSDQILKTAIEKIRNNEVEASQITKTVLVIDEAQDMDGDEFELIKSLMEHNEDMRVIAVGDDDQNIYEFRGANSRYLSQFIEMDKAGKSELIVNYRSRSNIVEFSNQFVSKIEQRLKEAPIIASQTANGKVKVVRYQSNSLFDPVVRDILSAELSGTVCVLTRTNEEALQVTGLLIRNGVPSKLIQTNDGFNLYNLAEVRFFISQLDMSAENFIIHDDIWASAKRSLTQRFQKSEKLELCNNLISDFEATNPKYKYRSDLEVFIRESRIEDFYNGNGETVFVSTIHKAKGKEFDNVFLMLNNFNLATDESKRQLYVALTRAKRNLTIHLNSSFLDDIKVEELELVMDNEMYLPPAGFSMQLSYKDVWLGFFKNCQEIISQLISGDELSVNGTDSLNAQGYTVLKFSNQFQMKIEAMKERGYVLKSGKVNFIVYWLGEREKQEVQIILPELYFERADLAGYVKD
ncbi:RecQ family ATP-dependent DNA helicase [Pseudobacter ginsenosidimutans]|uniref:RecQ family ATP-dependent DNA helicase n=1 Tax=Pseudobacter ginsenosidimutans TaxID=661488 RepID=UPI001CEF60E9|nr:RecQ family ATP-dependent DNA helicase [Pseudobacter ginsenosidimutans]